MRCSFIAVVFHCMSTIDEHFQLWLLRTIYECLPHLFQSSCVYFSFWYIPSSELAGSWGFNMFHLIFFFQIWCYQFTFIPKKQVNCPFAPYSLQSLSHVQLFATPWTVALQASLSITNSRSLLKLLYINSVIPSNHLILYCPLLWSSIFPSIRVFSNESGLPISWPEYWSFSISPSSECSGLTSFRINWFVLAGQQTLKSLLQHHSSKASILQHSAWCIIQLSHPYMTTGKTIALTRRTFVDKVMSLLFHMLSRLVIALPPRSKHLLISWLQSPSAVISEPQK